MWFRHLAAVLPFAGLLDPCLWQPSRTWQHEIMNASIGMILAAVVAVATACAGDLRTFTSADGSKTFEGELLAYSDEAEKVKVRMKDGRQATLPLSALSEKDTKWIRETGVRVLRVAPLEITIKAEKTEGEEIIDRGAGGSRTIRSRNEGYTVNVANPTKNEIGALDADYVFYVRRIVAETTEVQKHEGSITIPMIEAESAVDRSCGSITMEGRDKLLGLILRIKHGDQVLRSVETEAGLEAKYDPQVPRSRR